MAFYEVRVEGVQAEFFRVKANSAEEAMEKWSVGEFVGSDSFDFRPVEALLDFDQEDDDAEEDEYEDDPLQHGPDDF